MTEPEKPPEHQLLLASREPSRRSENIMLVLVGSGFLLVGGAVVAIDEYRDRQRHRRICQEARAANLPASAEWCGEEQRSSGGGSGGGGGSDSSSHSTPTSDRGGFGASAQKFSGGG